MKPEPRVPLRPLASVLDAREQGENPDVIERENIRKRREKSQKGARVRAEARLLLLAVFFFCAFTVVALRMGHLATMPTEEPQAVAVRDAIVSQRADIVDRNGMVLATNISTHSLYAQPRLMLDPENAAVELSNIFEDMKADQLLDQFNSGSSFIWLRRRLSPEQMQAVHDIGEPGLLFGPREMRLYPNGSLASHILGGTQFGREDVSSAEVIGAAGVEHSFDGFLRDQSTGGAPLQLSLDLTIQSAAEVVLAGGMELMNARGAASVLMDVHTGEIISIVSLPDFDPNDRPRPVAVGQRSPRFNLAVQGVFELGSTFKIFTAAQAMELGLVTPDTIINTSGPIEWGTYELDDFHEFPRQMTVRDVIVESSNVGTARMAQEIGAERQQRFLADLGLLAPSTLELGEAASARPLLPPNWSELSAMTISYGHGMSTSPVHLAAAYASLVNGGTIVTPTLLRRNSPQYGDRIVSEETSVALREMLRGVVTDGTASMAEVPGYLVGGKTGSADKPLENAAGYHEEKVIATFASVFPSNDPQYVLIVMLDEPEISALDEVRRTAGWTAVPVAAEMIRRIAPLLGIRPQIETSGGDALRLTAN